MPRNISVSFVKLGILFCFSLFCCFHGKRQQLKKFQDLMVHLHMVVLSRVYSPSKSKCVKSKTNVGQSTAFNTEPQIVPNNKL